MNQLFAIPLTFDEAVMQCTNSLQTSKNPEESLGLFLHILGGFYQGVSSYIFELNQETQIFTCKYQWNTKESVEFLSVLSDIPFTALENFRPITLEGCDVPIMIFQPQQTSVASVSPLFKPIQNILISPIIEKDVINSFVALTDFDISNFDARLFSCILLFIQESLQKREMYLQLASLHNLDPLTGFFNKTQYVKKLGQFQENPPNECGIALIQMNGLKKIGEVFGEKYVDVKIKNASILLREYIDKPFYRVSSQKFLCFVTEMDQTSFEILIDRIRLETSADKNASFVVGHSWYQASCELEKTILKAEESLAENQAEADAEYFGTTRENLVKDLQHGIDSGYFLVHLQPKIELTTLETMGAEILVRRYIPESQNLIPLDSFIPLYEQHEIVQLLDLHIFRKACEILSKWKVKGFVTPVSLHLNPITIIESGTVATLTNICHEFALSPELFIIEVAKRHGIGSGKISSLVKEEYRQHGFHFVSDYVSYVYSNYLKSTKVYVKSTEQEEDVEKESEMHENLKKVSKICETYAGQGDVSSTKKIPKELLHAINCSYGQGFFFSYPISQDEFYERYRTTLSC